MGSRATELGFYRQKMGTPNLFKITIVTLKAQKDALHIYIAAAELLAPFVSNRQPSPHMYTKTANAMLLNAITGNTAGVKRQRNVRHGDTPGSREGQEWRHEGGPKGSSGGQERQLLLDERPGHLAAQHHWFPLVVADCRRGGRGKSGLAVTRRGGRLCRRRGQQRGGDGLGRWCRQVRG